MEERLGYALVKVSCGSCASGGGLGPSLSDVVAVGEELTAKQTPQTPLPTPSPPWVHFAVSRDSLVVTTGVGSVPGSRGQECC